MKTEKNTTSEFDSTFVNVTLSAKKINGKYPIGELIKNSTGEWLMTEDIASNIKWIFPVRKNQILGVFEAVSYTSREDDLTGKNRVTFKLKPVFEGSSKLIEVAFNELTKTHYVTKHFKI